MSETETLFTAQEIAEKLRCSYKSVLRYIASGKLKCYEVARKKLITQTQLNEFLNKR